MAMRPTRRSAGSSRGIDSPDIPQSSMESRNPLARTELRSSKDERGLPVKRLEDKVDDAAGKGSPVFGAGEGEGKPDLGVTGTGGG
uniref:Uncharacterized protein n=1 Tax=Oryza punctata TaxID=4537 RepID=A0A0E0KK10_ORYPU